ncbi:MAG TPA: hypothetical protein VH062_00525 [Polyangiaceae bacterium]|jgi:hypothetical protein|nr:hypothetical protein [Polyangiaceae bacterium]
MIDATIRIGTEERVLDAADAQWVHQSINMRRNSGEMPCVAIRLRTDDINIRLSTPCCSGGGGGRPPNKAEKELFELWRAYGLDENPPDVAQVWPFLMRLRRRFGLRAA